ncbi:MAG: hypothetical protein CSA20_09085 [Deltaproteobacteria bacterium]|nr:MAG: hypothetical protein CSA20_09085 [Deltaproteobacteria bacterium]
MKRDHFLTIILFFLTAATGYFVYIQYKNYSIENEYGKALQINTLKNYNDFIEKYKNTKYSIKIAYYRDKKAFENATQIDTLEAYQDFLDSYPQSAWYRNVVYHRDRAALERAKKERTLKSIVRFLKDYPHSSWLPQANHYLRHQFGFKSLSEAEECLPDYNEKTVSDQ